MVPERRRFSLCTRRDIRKIEEIINGIHRLALSGETAAQFDVELAWAE